MLFRFSLYGFLKNQRYFEPFLILVFMEKGLSFFLIGTLVMFREIIVNLLEIPSGSLADVWGRRRCMILAFAGYLVSYLMFGFSTNYAGLLAAMFFLAIGDSFRSGTHKAMIFSWLRAQGREHERTRIYGFTRSWSQLGSALSCCLAAVFVFTEDSYGNVFFYAAVPCVLSIINFLGYPAALENRDRAGFSLKSLYAHTLEAMKLCLGKPALRRLVFESMGFEGFFSACKDYLQPVLQATALAAAAGLAFAEGWSDVQRSAILVGAVYLALFLGSAAASRKAHRVVSICGSQERAASYLWLVALIVCLLIAIGAWFGLGPLVIVAFVALHLLQNIWRPVLVSRFDAYAPERQGATILSIESQAQRGATMVLAPLLGFLVDWASKAGDTTLWPLGLIGLAICLLFWLTSRRHSSVLQGGQTGTS